MGLSGAALNRQFRLPFFSCHVSKRRTARNCECQRAQIEPNYWSPAIRRSNLERQSPQINTRFVDSHLALRRFVAVRITGLVVEQVVAIGT